MWKNYAGSDSTLTTLDMVPTTGFEPVADRL